MEWEVPLYTKLKKKKAEESKNVSSKNDDQIRTVLCIFTRINDVAQQEFCSCGSCHGLPAESSKLQ